jgi:hypothetical protein
MCCKILNGELPAGLSWPGAARGFAESISTIREFFVAIPTPQLYQHFELIIATDHGDLLIPAALQASLLTIASKTRTKSWQEASEGEKVFRSNSKRSTHYYVTLQDNSQRCWNKRWTVVLGSDHMFRDPRGSVHKCAFQCFVSTSTLSASCQPCRNMF